MAHNELHALITPVDYAQVTAIMETWVFPLITETFLFALHTVLTVYFVYYRWVKRQTAPLPRFMLIVALLMFAMFSLYWSLDVYQLWENVYRFLPLRQTGSKGAIDPTGVSVAASTLTYVQVILQFLIIVIGDTVSLWRAYVLLGRPRWLFLTMIGVVALESFAYTLLGLAGLQDFLPRLETSQFIRLLWSRQGICYLSAGLLTILAQSCATLSISFVAWTYWNDVRKLMPLNAPMQHSLAMLAVLIESGIVYLALLVVLGVISWAGRNGSVSKSTISFYVTPLLAMYPTLVVVLVATRRSVLERDHQCRRSTCASPRASGNVLVPTTVHFILRFRARSRKRSSKVRDGK
ncbi:unnamed protein product [Peniophora sp. CBMAI 1063]|nr:unnamed protein product [Peniophora sp. CBMAI 1063]